MADNLALKAQISTAVDTMAADMGVTWDGQLNWAATADALIDLIAAIGGKIPSPDLSTLLAAAAMARRQSLQAAPESEVLS